MSAAVTVLTARLGLHSVADTALKAVARLWFLVAVIGQWAFLYYIVAFYGPSTLTGNFQAWSKNTFLRKGYIAGDTAGNLFFALHVLLAAVVTFGGALQLVPQVRTRAISIHRWNGRLFLMTAMATSLAGVYMSWVRQPVDGGLALPLNAVLIFVFAVLAWRSARAGEISAHRRWALRAYLVANGVWFLRVGFGACILLDRNHVGEFIRLWNFGCYLVPLGVLELYLRAKDGAGLSGRFAMAGGLLVLTAFMGIGIFGFSMRVRPLLRLPLLDQKSSRLTDVLSQTIETKGIDAAVAQYRHLREQGFPELRESESDTNSLGYQLLGKGDKQSAIQVFQLNVETHPKSANVYDSLGEAYLAAGDKALAIENYQKAVAINPKKKTAVSALQELTNSKRKPYRPMVLFHIVAGSVALLSGAVAMSFRKGSRRHGVAGSVFFVSMLSMSASGAYRAFVAPDGEVVNVLMGVLTFYLVATAWLTARRRNGETGIFDWGALLVASAVAAGLANYGLEAAHSATGMKDGISARLYFVFGSVALLAAALDLRMIVRGGVFGAHRVARHLWRMCAALFIAVGSLFLGQPQVFPDALRNTGVLVVPSVLVVILLIFWLIRVLFTNAYERTASPKPKMVVGEAGT